MTVMLASVVTSASSPVWITVLLVLVDLAVKIATLSFIPQDRRPSSAMAWLLLMYLIPFLGLLLFFLVGSTTVDRSRRRIHHDVNELVHEQFSSTAEVDKATQFVNIEGFIMAWDDLTGPFFQACARAVQRGVTVRLPFYHLAAGGGSRDTRS